MKLLHLFATLVMFSSASTVFANSRIKDIATVQGMRDNQLVGYGLVIGLAGSGDSLRNSPFTEVSMRSMLQKLGVGLEAGSIGSKNVAAVVVTATLPPFVSEGSRIDVSVSSLGDSTSLNGGVLIMTPLVAADGRAYAMAQGPVVSTAIQAAGQAASITQGVSTTGRVSNGAIVERDNTADINALNSFALQLTNPDFKTATLIADAINLWASKMYGQRIASAHDFRSVEINRPKNLSASRLFAEIGELAVEADTAARIVIDEKNGTIVMGENVRISPIAISHGNIVIKVTERPIVVQPEPFSDGHSVTLPRTKVEVEQTGSKLAILRGPTLENLVSGLNKMGLKPTDMISILQSLKAAGALQAELVVQ
jgi:flagellar P-ring protein FlgI